MGVRVEVDLDDLRTARHQLLYLTDSVLALTTSTFSQVSSRDVAGCGELARSLNRFGTEWDHALTKVGDQMRAFADALDEIVSCYEDVERSLTSALGGGS